MKRVALALCALLFAACDPRISGSSIDAGPPDASGLECDENPCLNGGTCNLLPDGFRCLCPAGYEGQLCETDVDDCEPNPCKNGGFCADRVASYQCECSAGYTGVDCSTNVDDCESNPCQNGGTCTDMINGFQCDCAVGYTGAACEVDVDDCAQVPCDNGAQCQDEVNGFTCICKEGNTGPTCSNTVEPCAEDTCKNGGTCADGEDGFVCTCANGYNGVNCENNIDDCAALPCQNGATCADQVNGYACTCPDGYEGVNCENLVDPCNPNPCQNSGSCTSAGDYYVCACPPGYNGADCEHNIDDCASNPCANGGSCADAVNGFVCTCTNGYMGPTCNNEPPTCPQTDPCGDHGTCNSGVDGYTCECDAGYSGATCTVNVDDCTGDPCGDHGTCTDGENAFNCACDTGYNGPRCQNNIDNCEDEPCKNGGNCSDLVNGYSCQCMAGWGGPTCEANIDECDPNPCLHGGECDDLVNDYTCTCTPGYTGDNCETDECDLIGACGNGTCDHMGGCICEDGWQGDKCDENINECDASTSPCLHGGACTDSPGSFMCDCATAYTGVICDQCATGYQDNDDDGFCCAIGYAGSTCQACDEGYESVNGLCKKTCTSSPINCGDHGACDDSGDEPVCACEQSYFGPLCDSLSGMCTSGTPCGANGDCSMTSDTTFKCTCDPGYTGRNCEAVDECAMAVLNQMTPCQNGGTCIDGNNMYTCQCASGWLGADCSEVDNCVQGVPQAGACNGHGLCTDGNNMYTCACVTGWLGQTCDEPDDCVGNTCQHGTCVDGNATYTCDCSNTGYDGDKCQNDIDYCANTPCKNGGSCTDIGLTFQCNCAGTGYNGTTCEDDVDECADVQADVCGDGICTNGAGGDGYRCQCPAGTIDVDRNGQTCSQVVSLSAGATNTCAITALGSLHCWGDNTTAQLGQNTITNPPSGIRTPVRIATGTGWTKVSVGASHVCGIRSGRLYCWGSDTKRQCGGVTGFVEGLPHELRTDLTWDDVSVGDEHSCALSGTALYCWGNTADGQAGVATSAGVVDTPKPIAGTWKALSAGGFHTCAINTSDQLTCWGKNTANQLGGTQPIAVPAGNNGKWTSVKAGPTHTCAAAGAKTYCWGAGSEGSLGNGAYSDSATPVEVSAVAALGSLSTGDTFSCGIANDADAASTFQIYCWGTNLYNELLTADTKVNVPQIVSKGGTPAWTAYAVGLHHMCAVEAGLLYCWGSNTVGQAGTGLPDPTPVATATLVQTPAILHSVIDGCSPAPCKNGGTCSNNSGSYTCNCTGTGFSGANCTVETDECTVNPTICGQGTCRDLLDGDGYTCTCPDGLIDVDNTGTTCVSAKAISGGYNHTCVLTTSNTLHCWGSNRYGQFGLGAVGTQYYLEENSQTVRTPLRIKNVSGISSTNAAGWTNFGVGESHTCGTIPNMTGSENLYCWGNNVQGQLGRAIASSSDNEPAPYLLDGTHTWTALSVGYAHNCGISAGQLYCWGYNPYGQVGDGTQTTATFSLTPVALPSGETSWITVAAGGSHTCAVTNTNTTYCWGRQHRGQAGQGVMNSTVLTAPSRVTPSAAFAGIQSIYADLNHACGLVGTTAYCWGAGTLGGIGDGTATHRLSPTAVAGGLSFSGLTLGQNFGCGLVPVMGSNPAAYTLQCWGENTKNLLLDNTKTQANSPQAVLASRQWRVVDVAPLHICAVDNTDGKLYCWGDNGLEGGVGQGKLGSIPYSTLGNFDVGIVKAAAAIHAAQ